MPCPKCNSNELWDDQAAWGCKTCGWASDGGGTQNRDASRDIINRGLPDQWTGKYYGRPLTHSADREINHDTD